MLQLFIKGLDNKTCVIDYDKNTYFEKVFVELEKRYCLSRDFFWIRYHSAINVDMLISEQIQPGATLYMIGRINKTLIEDLIIIKSKTNIKLKYPRNMLLKSLVFKQNYEKKEYENNCFILNDLLDSSFFELFEDTKKLTDCFEHYYNIYVLNFSNDIFKIPNPIPSKTGLKHVISQHILNYIHQISILDIKTLVLFFDRLKIDYFKEMLVGYIAHYIYRKYSIDKLKSFDLI